jgi:hypothetical protein
MGGDVGHGRACACGPVDVGRGFLFFPIAGTQLFDGGANVLKPDLPGWFHALAVDSH